MLHIYIGERVVRNFADTIETKLHISPMAKGKPRRRGHRARH
jgi:hypothetical protein